MYDCRQFFNDGKWVAPAGRREIEVIDPATEQAVGSILLGTAEDVDAAVRAARTAFESFSRTSREERIALLDRCIAAYERNTPRLARAISDEMGAPLDLATAAQAGLGIGHLKTARAALEDFAWLSQGAFFDIPGSCNRMCDGRSGKNEGLGFHDPCPKLIQAQFAVLTSNSGLDEASRH